MLNRDFNTWLSGFRDSIADYGYYIDFEKVYRNIDKIRIELNIMNSLIGSKNIKADFKDLAQFCGHNQHAKKNRHNQSTFHYHRL